MLHNRVTTAKRSLSDEIRDQIIDRIIAEEFSTNKLPAESKLAKRFGVSINVVREALLLLREDGIVTKKHGSGNYFHRSALQLSNRLDRKPDFQDFLEANGYHPHQDPLLFDQITPPASVSRALCVPERESVFYYLSVIYADGNPAVFCESYFPASQCKLDPMVRRINLDFFDFLTLYCKHELAYGQIEYVAACATETEVKYLNIPLGQPHIVMEETFFSLEDIPIAYCRNRFNRRYIQANTFFI